MKNVFTNKNFVLIFLGALVSDIGNLFYSFAVSYWILDITNNNAIIQGTYLGVCGITYLLFSLIGGVFSDRFNKAKLMYMCDYIKAILIALSALIILFNNDNTTLNIIILFVMGIASNIIASVFSPASSSILPLILKPEQLQQAISYKSVLTSLQSIIGLCLAGIIYSLLPITSIFFIIALCYFLSAVSEMFIKYDYMDNQNKLTLKTTFNDIKDGFDYIKTKKSLASFLPIIIFINFFYAPISQNFISYFIKTDIASNSNYLLHNIVSPEMWGALFSISISITSVIFGIVLSTKKINKNSGKKIKKWLFTFGVLILLMAISYILLIDNNQLNTFLVILIIIALMMGMALSFINIPANTIIQTITDSNKLGKVSSITSMVSHGLIPVATFLAGFAITYLGSGTLLLICSIGLLLVATFALCNNSFNSIETNQ